jgi:hypothetical protein
MKKNNDPAALFEQTSMITNRCQSTTTPIVEEDMIAIILDAAPAECQAGLTSKHRVEGTT